MLPCLLLSSSASLSWFRFRVALDKIEKRIRSKLSDPDNIVKSAIYVNEAESNQNFKNDVLFSCLPKGYLGKGGKDNAERTCPVEATNSDRSLPIKIISVPQRDYEEDVKNKFSNVDFSKYDNLRIVLLQVRLTFSYTSRSNHRSSLFVSCSLYKKQLPCSPKANDNNF